MTKNAFYLSSVTILVIAIVIMWDAPETIFPVNFLGSNKGSSNQKAFPYAIANDTYTQHYTDQGLLNYTFHADRLEHYHNRNSDELEKTYTLIFKPKLTFFQEKDPWTIEANEGKLSQGGKKLTLWNNVSIQQQKQEGHAVQLQTEKLVVDPEAKYASTSEPVTITSATGKLTAVGMTANLIDKKIKLLSKVRGTHDPI